MVEVEDARKAVQVIQYSIFGMAEIFASGETVEDWESLISEAASAVLASISTLDLYLTGGVRSRIEHISIDSVLAVEFIARMKEVSFLLSSEKSTLTLRWPREGQSILSVEGPESVVSRWEQVMSTHQSE